jgi:tetratricopeptide (TPR) repeat protein
MISGGKMSPENSAQSDEGTVAPKSVQDYVRRGWSLHVKEEFDRSEADFRKAISMDSQSVEAYYGLGMSLLVQNRVEESAQFFQKTLDLLNEGKLEDQPGRASMLRHLAQTHIEMGQKGRSLEAKL